MNDQRGPHRVQAVRALLTLCGVLLIALVTHGIFANDAELLSGVLALVRDVVLAILAWAIGRYGHDGPEQEHRRAA